MYNIRFLTLVLITMLVFGAAVLSERRETVSAQTTTASPTPPEEEEIIEEDDTVIKIDTEAVNVLFTAQDNNRRLITDLRPEDVQIFENGVKQDIVDFGRRIDLPLSMAILIDTSVSQERTLPEEKDAALRFLEYAVRPSKDEVAIVTFTGETTLEQGLTNNMPRLRRAVERVRFIPPSGYIGAGVVTTGGGMGTPPISTRNQAVAGSTAIWDAIWVTSEEILGESPQQTRRAIILLSDGENTSGLKKLDDAVEAALRAEAIIYSIGIGDNFHFGVDKGALTKISERTGGRAYFPRDERQLREAFDQIQEEMRSQYLITYEPVNQTLDGSYRTIEIKVVNPVLQRQKVSLTHRQGYYSRKAN